MHTHTHIYIYIISRRSITPQCIKHSSKSLDVVQSLYFGNKLPSTGTYKKSKLYVPDEGSLLPKYRDCTISNYLELYIYIHVHDLHIWICIYIYIYVYIYMSIYIYVYTWFHIHAKKQTYIYICVCVVYPILQEDITNGLIFIICCMTCFQRYCVTRTLNLTLMQ